MNSYRILIIEDHVDTAQSLLRLLALKGHKVEVAGTCAQTVKLCSERAYDLLLIDVGLPDGDGTTLLKQLQGEKTVRAIALTGYAMPEDIRKCFDAGFVAHIAKPHTFEKLLEVIDGAMTVELPGNRTTIS